MLIVVIILLELPNWKPFLLIKSQTDNLCLSSILLFYFSKISLTPSCKVAILLNQKIYCPLWITAGVVLLEKDAIIDAKRTRVWKTKYIKVYILLNHFSAKFFNKMYKK